MAAEQHTEPEPDDAPRRRAVRGGRDAASPQRLRPAPTSSLSPSPSSLMPVGDDAAGEDGRAGRRQHHRAAGGRRPDAEDLVYLSGRVPRQLRDELHVRAIGEGRPVVELMRDALRGYLDRTEGPARP